MATLNEIFAAMPDPMLAGTHELLIIDPATRQIEIPEIESIFGVETDGDAERKYFQCPRYVGDGIDLSACKLRVQYQNASGTEEGRDGYLVNDVTVEGDYVYFSWRLSEKVCLYKGSVQFLVCAILDEVVAWNTTLASGTVLEGLPLDGEIVQQASSDIIAQLIALVESQSAAVKAAAAAATAEAKAEIDTRGAAVLASLPAEYTELANTVDKLSRDRAGAIICEAQGAAIQLQDSSDDYLAGLRIFGKSTQDGTPTPEAPVEIVSTPAPVVTVCGINLFNIDTMLGEYATLTDGVIKAPYYRSAANVPVISGEKYTISAYVYATTANEGILALSVQDGKEVGYTTQDAALGLVAGASTTPTLKSITFTAVSNYVSISANAYILDNIMVTLGGAAANYAPYTAGGVVQTVNALPGIPVSSGGNYTDADGQEWICDEVDLARGVYVQRINTLVFNGAEPWGVDGEPYPLAHLSNLPFSHANLFAGYYSHGEYTVFSSANNGNYAVVFPNGILRIRAGSESSADAFKEYAASQYAAGTPLTVQYILAEPIENALTPEEIAAFKTLHSNKPVTTILNDAGAHMAVEYVADTKTYIDNKFAALTAAIANTKEATE